MGPRAVGLTLQSHARLDPHALAAVAAGEGAGEARTLGGARHRVHGREACECLHVPGHLECVPRVRARRRRDSCAWGGRRWGTGRGGGRQVVRPLPHEGGGAVEGGSNQGEAVDLPVVELHAVRLARRNRAAGHEGSHDRQELTARRGVRPAPDRGEVVVLAAPCGGVVVVGSGVRRGGGLQGEGNVYGETRPVSLRTTGTGLA